MGGVPGGEYILGKISRTEPQYKLTGISPRSLDRPALVQIKSIHILTPQLALGACVGVAAHNVTQVALIGWTHAGQTHGSPTLALPGTAQPL